MIETGNMYCDSLNCKTSKSLSNLIFKSAIEQAQKEGWRITKTAIGNVWRHHCPKCSGQKIARPKEGQTQHRKEQWYDRI